MVAALERPEASGVFNVVDDEPAAASVWVPELTRARGSTRRPRRLPAWLARPLIGAYGVRFMTELRGCSNERAGRELGWRPAIPWRAGFEEG